ncbi:MAG: hypothetical protein QW270_06655 [Candidatus Bathyarchaeia archaeon]
MEVVYSFEEFKAKVDLAKPVHHCSYGKCIDKHGIFYRLEFLLCGIAKNDGHIICWVAKRRTTIGERESDKKWYNELVEKCAKPLGSTEGEWKE